MITCVGVSVSAMDAISHRWVANSQFINEMMVLAIAALACSGVPINQKQALHRLTGGNQSMKPTKCCYMKDEYVTQIATAFVVVSEVGADDWLSTQTADTPPAGEKS